MPVNAPQPSTAQTMPRRAAFTGDLAGAGTAAAVWPERQAVAVPGLRPLESAIMTVLWDAREPLTVRGVRDRMGGGGDPAYTRVMTVTTILWRKGLLSRDKLPGEADQRAWWYQPRSGMRRSGWER